MPVNSQHPDYQKNVEKWVRCRDVTEGSDQVKSKGNLYLPRLTGQTLPEYNAYKQRALFFSVTGRSLGGLVGMATRRSAKIDASEEMKDKYLSTMDKSNKISFKELLMSSVEEVLKVSRYYILVDWPKSGGASYIATYQAESVINWALDEYGNLIAIVICERVVVEGKDEFAKATVTQYRHLYLDQGVYKQTIYDSKMREGETFTPTVSGKTLDYIPMICVNTKGLGYACEKPPILDIADVNLSQYLSSADLEHGRHFTGLPTPWVTGAPSEGSLSVGSTSAWMLSNEKAKVGYLEFQGLGLKSLENAIAEKTGQMAQFSTRLMDTSTRGSEAAETVRMRHSSEAATLTTVVEAVESALNLIYAWIAEFESMEFESIHLNRDFLDSKMTHQELRALTEALVEGAIDQETFFYNLERGEMVAHDKLSFDVKPRVDTEDDTITGGN